MADSLTVRPGPRPKLDAEQEPKRKRTPQSSRDESIKRQIRKATAAAKAGEPIAGEPGSSPPAKPPGKFSAWAKTHKGELATGVVASLIAAYIFMKMNGSGSSLLSGSSTPTNPSGGGAGTVPTAGAPGDSLPPPNSGGGTTTTPKTTTTTTTTTPRAAPTGYTKAPSSQPLSTTGGQKAGGTPVAVNSVSKSTYARPVNKSGIPTLGSSPGAINPNVARDTIPAGHSRQNVLPNLAPQIRSMTSYGNGRAQPTVGPMTVAQRLNSAFQSYRTSHPGATSAEFAAALNGAAQAARNRSVTKGAGAANVTKTSYETRITGASQVAPTKAYSAAHGSKSSYAPQVRALR